VLTEKQRIIASLGSSLQRYAEHLTETECDELQAGWGHLLRELVARSNFPKLGGGGRRAQGRVQQPTRVYTEPHAPAGMSPAAQAAYKAIRQGKGKGRGKRVQQGRAQTGKGTASGQ
jgi:hypothetical protein